VPAQARPTDHEYHHLKGFFPQWQKLQEINTSDHPDLQLPGRPRHGPGHRAVPGGTMGRNLRHGPARPSCRASTAQLFSCWAGLRAQVFGPCSCQPIKHGPDLQLYRPGYSPYISVTFRGYKTLVPFLFNIMTRSCPTRSRKKNVVTRCNCRASSHLMIECIRSLLTTQQYEFK